MSAAIEEAVGGGAWSVSGVLYGVDNVLDDEGRPVSERRAPSVVKQGVPIVLKECPYHDERRGSPMNVSALAQITRYLPAVTERLADFRAATGAPTSYTPILMAVLDLLSQPAFLVLAARDTRLRVPAQAAVSHKLAAGYMGVVLGLLLEVAEGSSHPVTAEALLRFVHEGGYLSGASEVCAGPPQMIAKTSQVLIQGGGVASRIEPAHLGLIRLLALQIELGLAWRRFDAGAERQLAESLWPGGVHFRNDYVRRRFEARVGKMGEAGALVGSLRPRVPSVKEYGWAAKYTEELHALLTTERPLTPEVLTTAHSLLAFGEGAIDVRDAVQTHMARRLSDYVAVYRAFHRAQWDIEQRLRELLDYPIGTDFAPSGFQFSSPQALQWFEATLGHRLQLSGPPDFSARWTNHRRKVAFAA